MSTPDKPLPDNEEQAQAALGEMPAEAALEAAAAARPVTAEILALAAEAADLKDKLLRALAETENLRRRTEREIADARAYGITGFARDVLSVADNMERARAAVPADALGSDPALQALVEGVDLTARELAKALEKHGVRRIEPAGEKFDPNRHQAMFEVPDASVPSGSVVQVVQAGYVIGDRVLRPALVGVSKGGPKVAPPANENAPAPDTAAQDTAPTA